MAGMSNFRPPHIEAKGIIFRSAKLDTSSSTIYLFDPLEERPSSQSALEALGFRRIAPLQSESPWFPLLWEINFPKIPCHLTSPSAYAERREWAQRMVDREDVRNAESLCQARSSNVYYEYTGPKAEEFYVTFVDKCDNHS